VHSFHIWRYFALSLPLSAYSADAFANSSCHRNYPWSMYAVFQTTITQWAFPLDCLLFAFFYKALSESGYYAAQGEEQPHADQWHRSVFWALFIAHFIFAKTIKLVPHLLRNPGDVRFIPISILFGYFHNLIKLYGCITVTEVCFQLASETSTSTTNRHTLDNLGHSRRR
jgi:hypothetical protein